MAKKKGKTGMKDKRPMAVDLFCGLTNRHSWRETLIGPGGL